MLADCKAWREGTDKVNTTLDSGKASADKVTLHAEQDKQYTDMRARWVEVDKSCKDWSVKLDELAGMWTKQTGKCLNNRYLMVEFVTSEHYALLLVTPTMTMAML